MLGSRSTVWGAAVVSVVGLLAANAWVSGRNTRSIVDNEQSVAHTRHVLQTLEGVRATMAEAEAAQRAFLIGGDRRYLKVLRQASDGAEHQVRRLVTLVAGNAQQRTRAARLETLLARRLVDLRQTGSVLVGDGAAPTQGLIASDEGQRFMDRGRALIEAMEQTEDALLGERAAATARSLRIKTATSGLATAIGMLAVVLAFLLFRRMLADRSAAAAQAEARARREAAMGAIRQDALSNISLQAMMDRAVHTIAKALDAPFVKVLELLSGEQAFLLRAGLGWKEGCVGNCRIGADDDSQAGYTLRSSRPVVGGDLTTYEPVVVADLAAESRFTGPELLREHGVVSGMSVIIHDRSDRPYGVLGVHATCRRAFTDEEQKYLQGMANVLASAIQRRRADAALRESETSFRTLAECAPGLVWSSLPDGRCDYVNQRWCDSTGLSLQDTRDMGWVSALHPDDVEPSVDRWMQSMETGEPFECEYRFRMRDGSYRWHLGRAAPVRSEEDGVVKWLGNAMDIEEHRRMEDELREADRQKNRFLAMLGHELRNPLTPIVNAVELLERRGANDAGNRWEIVTIERHARHITRLVDDLLDASRVAHGQIELKREVADLESIVARAVDLARPLIEARGHTLDLRLPDDPIRLDADATRLTQALGNLLTNAANYTEAGGRVGVYVERQGARVQIKVTDTGVGITAELLPRIFDIFRRGEETDRLAPSGMGIGLALTKRLIEMHGGDVQASSEGPGRGSAFRVHLPALPQRAASAKTRRGAERLERPVRHCRVLIVDDNTAVAESYALLLRGEGYTARIAQDGTTALGIAREFRPEVVLLDVGLPDMDGYEVARRLRREPACSESLLLAITGYGQSQAANADADSPFSHYLVKPVRFEVVESLIGAFQSDHAGPAGH